MINLYPRNRKIKKDIKKFFSSSCGIADPYIDFLPDFGQGPSMQITQSFFPPVEKSLFNNSISINYHISGYGVSDNESVIRLLGETIERYSFVTSKCTLFHDFIEGSYQDLKKQYDLVLPLKYLNVISMESIKKMQSYGIPAIFGFYKDTDIIEWIPMNSLLDNKSKVYIPKDMICPDYISRYQAMSTGTATHGSYYKALSNAIVEYLQIHTFMKFWYARRKAETVILSDSFLQKILDSTIYQRFNDFDILVLDITDTSINFPTFLAIIINKNKKSFPLCSFGIQSGYDVEEAIFRAIMESSAIYNALPFMYLSNPRDFDLKLEDLGKSMNLDDNFFTWSTINEVEKKLAYIDSIRNKKEISLSVLLDKYNNMKNYGVEEMIDVIKRISQFACFRNISHIDAEKSGYYTMRVLIPECLPMCIPSYPFDNHPVLKDIISRSGGSDEYFPHPLP